MHTGTLLLTILTAYGIWLYDLSEAHRLGEECRIIPLSRYEMASLVSSTQSMSSEKSLNCLTTSWIQGLLNNVYPATLGSIIFVEVALPECSVVMLIADA